MRSLTREEAADRAALLSVDGYAVDLDLTAGERTFGSRVTVTFGCTAPGATTFVELRADRVVRASLNGRDLDPASVAGNRLPLTGLAEANELVVACEMAYSNTGEGLHRFVDPADGRVYLHALSFLDNAQCIFPCFDQPDLKAPVTLTVTADPLWTVRANGAVVRAVDGRWSFATTAPIATYLVTVVAGEWHVVEADHDGIPLGLICRASLAEHLGREAGEILTVTRQCFDRYHELFGVRYPFGKYDQAFVPEFRAGAMENPGCVTLRDEFVFRSAVTGAQREARAVVIAHEMAHMWFGDLVTMRWWDDLWLNESFAEYLGFRVTAEATRFADAWVSFAVGTKAWGYAADQRPSTHPVAPDEVADAAAALLNFDGISYAKGAAVLRQLVEYVGEDAFFAGLREYFARHAFANATLDDLLAALSEAAGRDLGDWAGLWLRRAGVNILAPVVSTLDNERYAEVAVRQDGEPQRPHRLAVGLYDLRGDTLVRRRRVSAVVDAELAELPSLAGEPVADLVLVNDGDPTYAKIRLPAQTWPRLPELLPRADPLTRALLWSAAWDATRDADLPAWDFIALVSEALPMERQPAVVGDMIRFAQRAAECYLSADERDEALFTTMSALAGALIPTRGTDLQLSFARGVIRCVPRQALGQISRMRDWLADGETPFGLVIDADLRWEIVYRLAALGEDVIDAESARDRTAAGEELAARCRAALPDADAKAEAWRTILTDTERSNRIVLAAATGFWQPHQADITDSYVRRYFAEMPLLAGTRTPNVVERLAATAYPRFAVSTTTVAAAHDLLARDDIDPALRRAVVDATDELERALRARARSGGPDAMNVSWTI